MPDSTQDDQDPNADLKAKMKEALARKQGNHHPDDTAGSREKAHGPEVVGRNAGTQMHRRKAGGGGA